MTDNNRPMTDEQQMQLGETADSLADYGYITEADHIGRIMEDEIILAHTPGSVRRTAGIVSWYTLIDTARAQAVDKPDQAAALADLLTTLRPDDAADIRAYITGI